MKKMLSMLLSAVITVSMFGTVALADYSDVGGTKTWDFAEYATKVTATQDPKTTTYAEIDSYNGIRIFLAVNNEKDYVDATGIHLGGAKGSNPSDGSSGRYITYTPDVSGTLYVTGYAASNKTNRWGIVEGEDGGFIGDESSTNNETDTVTVQKNCTAGTTYYVYGRDAGMTVTSVLFVPEQIVINETKTFTEEEGYEGNATAVKFTVNPGTTTVSGIDVTYNDVTKSLTTPELSGNGTIVCGIIVGEIVTADAFAITVK